MPANNPWSYLGYNRGDKVTDDSGTSKYKWKIGDLGIGAGPQAIDSGAIARADTVKNSMNPTQFDFLKEMLDPSIYAGLKNPDLYSNKMAGLAGAGKTFLDFYKSASTAGSDADFSSLLQSIQAPSSVDAVEKSLEQDYLQQTLDQIGRDTEGAVGGLKSDFLDRGLGNAGRTSDIEQNAIAQARAGGARTAAGARTQLGMAELARQKAREDQEKAALGQKYQTGVARETQASQIGATGALSTAQMMNQLLGQEYGGAESAAGRALTGAMNYSTLAGGDKQKFYTTMIDAILKNKGLDLSKLQEFNKLEYGAQQGSANRTIEMLMKQLESDTKRGIQSSADDAAMQRLFVDKGTDLLL